MKVGLLLCPFWDHEYPAASLALLAALLRQRGHEVVVSDINHSSHLLEMAAAGPEGRLINDHASPGDPRTDPSWVREHYLSAYGGWLEGTARSLIESGCRLVGFSMYYSNTIVTLEVARLIKRLAPSVKVVIGGPSCLTYKECLEYMAHDCLDAVLFGEADRSLPRLADALERTGRLEASPGVLLREDPATWKDEQDRVEDLDGLPFADFSVFGSLELYEGKTIHTTRGCVRRCVYCADWREMPYRHMSGRRVFEEVVHQLGCHPDQRRFFFADSVLNGSVESVEDFCDRALAADLRVRWAGYAIVRPEMTPRLLDKMHRAGCGVLIYGVESGSQKVLRDMSKNVPVDMNGRILKDSRDAGIATTATWIVGFPTETDSDFEDSVAFVRKNATSISVLTPSLFSIVEVKDQAQRLGLASTESDLFWETKDGSNDLPKRVARLRRLMETAQECGVRALYQGNKTLADFPKFERRLLSMHRGEPAA